MSVQKTSDKYPFLYHYTDYSGFIGIMDTQTLWAKYFRDLNDTSEIFHSQEKLCELLVPTVKRDVKRNRNYWKPAIRTMGGIDALARHRADIVLRSSFEVAFGADQRAPMFPLYVVSFCSHIDDTDDYTKENGLLSMWRGYGKNGGIALVFDTKDLEECLRRESEEYHYNFAAIGNVVYSSDDTSFGEEFGSFIELLKSKAMQMLTNSNEFDVGTEFLQKFLETASRFKHRAFSEEQEVRIVASPWTDEQFELAGESPLKKKEPRRRKGSTFIDLFDGNHVPRLPIRRVIVGPHHEQADRYREVCKLLRSRSDIQITRSETPYLEN